jgi:hypothetical protein
MRQPYRLAYVSKLIALIAMAGMTQGCMKGEAGPAGPTGPEGMRGPAGSDGRNGESVKAPLFSGFYRLHVSIPMTKDIDSTQALFFGENWSFRLYRGATGSCALVNQGTIDWGRNPSSTTVLFKDTTGAETFFSTFASGSDFLFSDDDENFLSCMKCQLVPAKPCMD